MGIVLVNSVFMYEKGRWTYLFFQIIIVLYFYDYKYRALPKQILSFTLLVQKPIFRSFFEDLCGFWISFAKYFLPKNIIFEPKPVNRGAGRGCDVWKLPTFPYP